eukprot:946109-Rhodomonas_salina.2
MAYASAMRCVAQKMWDAMPSQVAPSLPLSLSSSFPPGRSAPPSHSHSHSPTPSLPSGQHTGGH